MRPSNCGKPILKRVPFTSKYTIGALTQTSVLRTPAKAETQALVAEKVQNPGRTLTGPSRNPSRTPTKPYLGATPNHPGAYRGWDPITFSCCGKRNKKEADKQHGSVKNMQVWEYEAMKPVDNQEDIPYVIPIPPRLLYSSQLHDHFLWIPLRKNYELWNSCSNSCCSQP